MFCQGTAPKEEAEVEIYYNEKEVGNPEGCYKIAEVRAEMLYKGAAPREEEKV